MPLPFEGHPSGLCLGCRGRLRRPSAAACRRCGTPVEAGGPRGECGACLSQPGPLERLVVAYLYVEPLASAIRAHKFGRAWYLGPGLGRLLAARLEEEGLEARGAVVTAVGTGWWRRIRRGHDHVRALADGVGAALGLPVARLVRKRSGPRQATLGAAERRALSAAAFAAAPLHGGHVVLVDDVTTTGATLRAAATALRRAGAARVSGVALARTPRDSERPRRGIGTFDSGCAEP